MTEDEDLQAAEWVLGTLDPIERRALEHKSASDPVLRERLAYWQDRLAPLHALAPPEEPPEAVWRSISRTIDGISEQTRRPRFSWRDLWNDLPFWRGAGMTATAVAASIAVLFVASRRPVEERLLVAVLSSAEGRAGWLVEADARRGEVAIQPVAAEPPTNRVPELWLIPAGGAPPISLGLLDPAATSRQALGEDALRALLQGQATLAVSLEPPGGSPAAGPTGPVVEQGALVEKRF